MSLPDRNFGSTLSEFNNFYFDSYRTWGEYYNEAYGDIRVYAGDAWPANEKQKLQQQQRSVININRVRRVVQMFAGFERENRKSIVVAPFEHSDEDTADQLTDLMYHIVNRGNAYQTFSDGFEHHLKTGLSIIGISMNYNRDKINGDIDFYWKPFNSLVLDPYMTKRDLSDCDQAASRDLFSREQVKALLPWVDPKEIDQLPTGLRDVKYPYLGPYRVYNSTYLAQNLLTYDQYWKVYQKPIKLLIDLESGESRELDEDMDLDIIKQVVRQNSKLEIRETFKRSVRLHIIVGGVVLYEGPDPTGLDDYPFRPLICYFEPLMDIFSLKIQGIVRAMKDPQWLYNKKWSSLTDYNESILNTGWIVENGAVVDPAMLYQTGQGRTVVLNKGFGMQSITQIKPAELPVTALQYSDRLEKDLIEVPGASDETMGISSSGDTQIAGKLAMVRASNGLKSNRSIFDNYEFSVGQLAKLIVQTVQKNWSIQKIERILGKPASEKIKAKDFTDYDCVMKQGVLTSTQQEAYYHELLRMKELGLPIPDDEIIEAAPLQKKSKLKEKMAQIAQQAQEQQQVMLEDKRIANALLVTKAEEQIALAQTRRSEIVKDLSLSKLHMAQANLDQVKAMKEIESMDMETLRKAAEIYNLLQATQAAQQGQSIDADIERTKKLAEPQAQQNPAAQAAEPQQQEQL